MFWRSKRKPCSLYCSLLRSTTRLRRFVRLLVQSSRYYLLKQEIDKGGTLKDIPPLYYPAATRACNCQLQRQGRSLSVSRTLVITWFTRWLACATTGTRLNGEILRRTIFYVVDSWAFSINPEHLAKSVVAQQPQRRCLGVSNIP
jgi:hypothetical protein